MGIFRDQEEIDCHERSFCLSLSQRNKPVPDGVRVRLAGLAAAYMNGRTGTRSLETNARGRYTVVLDPLQAAPDRDRPEEYGTWEFKDGHALRKDHTARRNAASGVTHQVLNLLPQHVFDVEETAASSRVLGIFPALHRTQGAVAEGFALQSENERQSYSIY